MNKRKKFNLNTTDPKHKKVSNKKIIRTAIASAIVGMTSNKHLILQASVRFNENKVPSFSRRDPTDKKASHFVRIKS